MRQHKKKSEILELNFILSKGKTGQNLLKYVQKYKYREIPTMIDHSISLLTRIKKVQMWGKSRKKYNWEDILQMLASCGYSQNS